MLFRVVRAVASAEVTTWLQSQSEKASKGTPQRVDKFAEYKIWIDRGHTFDANKNVGLRHQAKKNCVMNNLEDIERQML